MRRRAYFPCPLRRRPFAETAQTDRWYWSGPCTFPPSSRALPSPSAVVPFRIRSAAKMNGLRRDDLDDLFPGLLDSLLDAAARQAVRVGSG
ncbi:conserved hypothetical protein [Streptomyces sviceus ATCC 29083]|uniref:Uncharacterized protein n=1 Tax=Streptomyces sviceus (strain ATCC 29083 / DSM 924 / JCM 4929 / NBRC 13980 / NCIMB 11184 / NRRL 5439 / UC 5370) TaxID=463191 RepID=B5I641_STRX2|nr:conserved hypothetical protein [Streptomyces sviceus ATCC 29083]